MTGEREGTSVFTNYRTEEVKTKAAAGSHLRGWCTQACGKGSHTGVGNHWPLGSRENLRAPFVAPSHYGAFLLASKALRSGCLGKTDSLRGPTLTPMDFNRAGTKADMRTLCGRGEPLPPA